MNTALMDSALSLPTAPPTVRRRTVTLTPAARGLWRVADPAGRVIGHLQAYGLDGQIRYRARRFHAATRRFRDVGEFWSADDAVDCLLLSR